MSVWHKIQDCKCCLFKVRATQGYVCLPVRSCVGQEPRTQALHVYSSNTNSFSLQGVHVQQQLTSPLRITWNYTNAHEQRSKVSKLQWYYSVANLTLWQTYWVFTMGLKQIKVPVVQMWLFVVFCNFFLRPGDLKTKTLGVCMWWWSGMDGKAGDDMSIVTIFKHRLLFWFLHKLPLQSVNEEFNHVPFGIIN